MPTLNIHDCPICGHRFENYNYEVRHGRITEFHAHCFDCGYRLTIDTSDSISWSDAEEIFRKLTEKAGDTNERST